MNPLSKKFFVICPIFYLALQSSLAFATEPLPKEAPTPSDNPTFKAKVELGRKLYFDPRLSRDDTVSCNTCHDVTRKSGTDEKIVSVGIGGQKGGRNSPTVWNAAFWSVQFWDGRAPTLEEQAKGPLINPIEMGMENHDAVMQKVLKIAEYKTAFEKVFGTPNITIDHLAKAIAAFERTLITPNSAYDQFLKGNKEALSSQAKRGLNLVQSVGCTTCHMGPHFAGPNLPTGQGFYQKFPLISGSEYDQKYELAKDLGRYEVTKKDSDKNFWRVPSWRNVTDTAPYFHNGSVKDLKEAIRVMAKTQLNKTLNNTEVNDIAAFLKTLSGKKPKVTR